MGQSTINQKSIKSDRGTIEDLSIDLSKIYRWGNRKLIEHLSNIYRTPIRRNFIDIDLQIYRNLSDETYRNKWEHRTKKQSDWTYRDNFDFLSNSNPTKIDRKSIRPDKYIEIKMKTYRIPASGLRCFAWLGLALFCLALLCFPFCISLPLFSLRASTGWTKRV